MWVNGELLIGRSDSAGLVPTPVPEGEGVSGGSTGELEAMLGLAHPTVVRVGAWRE